MTWEGSKRERGGCGKVKREGEKVAISKMKEIKK